MSTHFTSKTVETSAGTSLLELTVASALIGVGTLAVFTLFLHWHPYLDTLDEGYEILNDQQIKRPRPHFERRLAVLACEIEK